MTGPGPDPGQRAQLFERFWRGADAAERPGSGLGLSIVAAIVERHGGTITVDGSSSRSSCRVTRTVAEFSYFS